MIPLLLNLYKSILKEDKGRAQDIEPLPLSSFKMNSVLIIEFVPGPIFLVVPDVFCYSVI